MLASTADNCIGTSSSTAGTKSPVSSSKRPARTCNVETSPPFAAAHACSPRDNRAGRQRDALGLQQRVTGAAEDARLVLAHQFRIEFIVQDRVGQFSDPDFRLLLNDRRRDLAPIGDMKADLQPWMLFHYEAAGAIPRHHARIRTEHDVEVTDFESGEQTDVAQQFPPDRIKVPGVPHHHLAEAREHGPACLAIEETDAEGRFQCLNALGECRLRDVQRRGSSSEVPVLCENHDVAKAGEGEHDNFYLLKVTVVECGVIGLRQINSVETLINVNWSHPSARPSAAREGSDSCSSPSSTSTESRRRWAAARRAASTSWPSPWARPATSIAPTATT